MTAADFRRLALGLDGAIEGAHMGHPDFRANGRIFASLRADGSSGTVKLPLDEQPRFVREHEAFVPESGAWGRQGYTRVLLREADPEAVGEALTLAWQGVMIAAPARARSPKRPSTASKVSARGKRAVRKRGR